MDTFVKALYRKLNPEKNPDLQPVFQYSREHLPTLWLLGKTGAGKSSLIQALTGLDGIAVGRGFRPCTMTAMRYVFPEDRPLLAFLDTRGLGEADYDPREDIRACEEGSHALIVVMKAEDPEQSDVLTALRGIRKTGSIRKALLVHTGVALLDVEERARAIRYNLSQVEVAWGKVDSIAVDFIGRGEGPLGLHDLMEGLSAVLPMIAGLFERERNTGLEEENFQKLKKEIMWYAAAAAATDALPVVGLVTVPAIQSKMLHSLASQYGLEWNLRHFRDFLAAMGTGFALQYASGFGRRQLVKWIPVYGQIVGGASAGVMSYGFTYALGRVACMYFYGKICGTPLSSEALRTQFNQAFSQVMPVNHAKKS